MARAFFAIFLLTIVLLSGLTTIGLFLYYVGIFG